MNSKLTQPWIPLERIATLVQLEPALVILGMAIASWVIYRLLLREVSQERHKNLKNLFRNLAANLLFGILLFLGYVALRAIEEPSFALRRLTSYVGLLAVFSGAVNFVKVCRILTFEYLFLGHMRVGVPILLVNIFTLILSAFLGGWLLTEIFSIQVAPFLATSAIFSLVLGLALQDTLGNLFAGIALQLDKPYELGDWIEVNSGGTIFIGQVQDISWRATFLVGMWDEGQTIPNRVMAQAQVSNFSQKSRPILRRQVFRVPFDVPTSRVKEILCQAACSVPAIRQVPAPFVIAAETTESWVAYRLLYFIDDYGSQFLIGDQVLSRCLEELAAAGVNLASQRLHVVSS